MKRKNKVIVEDKYWDFWSEMWYSQGSVLSSIIFSLLMNEILDYKPPGVQYKIYADEKTMWYRHE